MPQIQPSLLDLASSPSVASTTSEEKKNAICQMLRVETLCNQANLWLRDDWKISESLWTKRKTKDTHTLSFEKRQGMLSTPLFGGFLSEAADTLHMPGRLTGQLTGHQVLSTTKCSGRPQGDWEANMLSTALSLLLKSDVDISYKSELTLQAWGARVPDSARD